MMKVVKVLVVHSGDASWAEVERQLERIFSEGLVGTFVVLPVGSASQPNLDPTVRILRAGANHEAEWLQSTLLGHMASLGEVDKITIVGLNFTSSSDETAAEIAGTLDAGLTKIRSLLVRFATTIERVEVRCAVVAEDEPACGEPFFSPTADVNVLVLPRDVSMTRAVARPITRGDRELFAVHAALEICSLTGLWEAMDESPLDGLRARQLGRRGYELRLFSSRIKGLLTPPLPMADLVDNSSELPLPNGYNSVDNLRVIVDRLATNIYPDNLAFLPIPRNDVAERRNWWSLATDYGREFGRMIRSIPSMMRDGFKGELEVVGAHALDELLGGAKARIRPIIPAEVGTDEPPISAEEIEEIIRDIELREDRPLIEALSPDQWNVLVRGVLAVADANPAADPLLHSVMPAGFLVSDKTHLAPNPATVAAHITSVVPPEHRSPAPEAEEPPSDLAGATGESPDDQSVDSEEPDDVPLSYVAPGEVDLVALREAVRRSGMARPVAADARDADESDGADVSVGGTGIEVDRADSTLVGRITARFDAEFRKAEESVFESLAELRAIPTRFGSSEAGTVSRSVFVTIALALGVIIVSLATHDPLRSLMSFDWTTKRNRDFAWVAMSTIVMVVSLASMPSSTRRNWQSRTMTTVAFCAGILAVEYVAFDAVRDAIVGFSWASGTALVAIVILLFTSVVNIVSSRRNFTSGDPIRKRLSRVLTFVLWIYLVLGTSAFVAGPESFLIGWEDPTRRRLLVASQFVGWICLLMATLVIVAVRVRQQNSHGSFKESFKWAQDNLIHAIDNRRILGAAYTQWLMTSAVLSRILWHPLGREATELVPFVGTLSGDESVLKFDIASVELSDQGRVALLAKLKQMFVRRGWLQVQFDHACSEYRSEVAFVTGDPAEDHDPVSCPSVPLVEEILSGEARGDRFAFAERVMNGEFDRRLLASATHGNLDAVYASILTDERMHSVVRSQHEFATGSDFLRDIVPAERSKIPPRMLTTRNVPGDPVLLMDSHLWWPQTALLELPQTEHVGVHSSKILHLQKLDDTVVMVAVLTELSQPFLNTDVAGVVDVVSPESGSG